MPAPAPQLVDPVVRWCLDRGWKRITVHHTRARLEERLHLAGVEVVSDGADAVLWLDDTVSVVPRPGLAVPSAGCDVVVEASLPRGPVEAIAVELDRVVVAAGSGVDARRVEFVDGAAHVRPLTPWPLVELDGHIQSIGGELIARTVDWSGARFEPESPCHLSWFRNVGVEPQR